MAIRLQIPESREEMRSFGPTYDPIIDGPRIRNQHEVIKDLMLRSGYLTYSRMFDILVAAYDTAKSYINQTSRNSNTEDTPFKGSIIRTPIGFRLFLLEDVMKGHIAKYGNVSIKRGYCSSCKGHAFVLDGELQCCDKPFKQDSSDKWLKYKIIAQSLDKRKQINRKIRESLIKEQDGKCIYCQYPIRHLYLHKGKTRMTRVNIDHFIPFSYSQFNNKKNYLAACGVCNRIKADKIFATLEDARAYVKDRRAKINIEVLEEEGES